MPLLLLVAVVLPSLSAAQTPPRRVIITAFGPFAGRGLNGSETLAHSLAAWKQPEVVIETAVWDVRWGRPAEALQE
jgi:hypothetical protein